MSESSKALPGTYRASSKYSLVHRRRVSIGHREQRGPAGRALVLAFFFGKFRVVGPADEYEQSDSNKTHPVARLLGRLLPRAFFPIFLPTTVPPVRLRVVARMSSVGLLRRLHRLDKTEHVGLPIVIGPPAVHG